MKYVGNNGRNYFYEGLFGAEEQQDAEQRRAFALEREAQAERIRVLREALETIIMWNRDHATAQYGNPDKAESWACIVKARAALEATND